MQRRREDEENNHEFNHREPSRKRQKLTFEGLEHAYQLAINGLTTFLEKQNNDISLLDKALEELNLIISQLNVSHTLSENEKILLDKSYYLRSNIYQLYNNIDAALLDLKKTNLKHLNNMYAIVCLLKARLVYKQYYDLLQSNAEKEQINDTLNEVILYYSKAEKYLPNLDKDNKLLYINFLIERAKQKCQRIQNVTDEALSDKSFAMTVQHTLKQIIKDMETAIDLMHMDEPEQGVIEKLKVQAMIKDLKKLLHAYAMSCFTHQQYSEALSQYTKLLIMEEGEEEVEEEGYRDKLKEKIAESLDLVFTQENSEAVIDLKFNSVISNDQFKLFSHLICGKHPTIENPNWHKQLAFKPCSADFGESDINEEGLNYFTDFLLEHGSHLSLTINLLENQVISSNCLDKLASLFSQPKCPRFIFMLNCQSLPRLFVDVFAHELCPKLHIKFPLTTLQNVPLITLEGGNPNSPKNVISFLHEGKYKSSLKLDLNLEHLGDPLVEENINLLCNTIQSMNSVPYLEIHLDHCELSANHLKQIAYALLSNTSVCFIFNPKKFYTDSKTLKLLKHCSLRNKLLHNYSDDRDMIYLIKAVSEEFIINLFGVENFKLNLNKEVPSLKLFSASLFAKNPQLKDKKFDDSPSELKEYIQELEQVKLDLEEKCLMRTKYLKR